MWGRPGPKRAASCCRGESESEPRRSPETAPCPASRGGCQAQAGPGAWESSTTGIATQRTPYEAESASCTACRQPCRAVQRRRLPPRCTPPRARLERATLAEVYNDEIARWREVHSEPCRREWGRRCCCGRRPAAAALHCRWLSGIVAWPKPK